MMAGSTGSNLDAASPEAVRLLSATRDTITIGQLARLIADRGSDSPAVWVMMVCRCSEPIMLARCANMSAAHQDAWIRRQGHRHWIEKHIIGGRGTIRRVTVLYDRLRAMSGGCVHLMALAALHGACSLNTPCSRATSRIARHLCWGPRSSRTREQ